MELTPKKNWQIEIILCVMIFQTCKGTIIKHCLHQLWYILLWLHLLKPLMLFFLEVVNGHEV
jgi:hypothetical protein